MNWVSVIVLLSSMSLIDLVELMRWKDFKATQIIRSTSALWLFLSKIMKSTYLNLLV